MGVTAFLLLSYVALRTPWVQTSLVRYVTNRIEQTTGVRMQIGGVDFRPMKSLILNDVLLRDFSNDTLIYCRNLSVKIDSFRFADKYFTIKEIMFDKACFNLFIVRKEDGAIMNIERVIESLGRKPVEKTNEIENVSEKKSKEWFFTLDKISVRNSRFAYREDKYEDAGHEVNWTDVYCTDLNVDVSGFDFSEDRTSVTVSGLSLKEKSGLEIKQLDGKVVVRPGNMLITECRIALNRSEIDLVKLEFNWTPDQRDWRYFITRMQQYYELGPSSVSFVDLAYFNENLIGIENTIKCSGVVFNTINKLEGKDIHIEIGERSILQGRFKSSGLPDIWNVVFDIDLHDTHLNPDDLETVYLPWFAMHIPVPEPLHRLRYIDFNKVAVNGTLTDFTVDVESVTPGLQGDVTFAYCNDTLIKECSLMSGDFNFSEVECGKFTDIGILAKGMIAGSYSGKFDGRGPAFNVKSRFNSLYLNNGQLKDLDVYLTWEGNKLDVVSEVKNDDVRGGLVLTYDMSDEMKFLSVKGKLRVDDLNRFGYSYWGEKESAGCSFYGVYVEDKVMDNSFGYYNLSGIEYSNILGAFGIDSIEVESSRNGSYRTATLHSDIADMNLDGSYEYAHLGYFLQKVVSNYIPAYMDRSGKGRFGQAVDFNYNGEIRNVNAILRVLYPGLRVSDKISLSSYFKQKEEEMSLTISADTVNYQDVGIYQARLDLKGTMEHYRMVCTAGQVAYMDSYQLYNIRNELLFKDNRFDERLTWCNWKRHTYSGELAADIQLMPGDPNELNLLVTVKPGTIVLADSVWHVKRSEIRVVGKNIDVNDFSISRGDQYLVVGGKLSETPEDMLSFNFKQFSIAEFSRLFSDGRYDFFGTATGKLTIQDYYKNKLLDSDVEVLNWGLGKDTLGLLHIKSYWDPGKHRLVLGAVNRTDNIVPLTLAGYYEPSTDSLRVNASLSKVGVSKLGHYLTDYVSESGGFVYGAVNVAGTLANPDVSGTVYLDSISMKVTNLNTKFFVNDRLHIVNNRLAFKDLAIKDVFGNQSVCSGEYRFGDNRYDLKIRSRNFLLLNTNASQDQLYYGKVYVSGITEIDNRDGITNIMVNARTEEGSKLFIPLNTGGDEQVGNFLHFVNPRQSARRRNQVVYNQEQINLDASLELNDNLEIQVIFDPTVGDILKTTGGGDIRVALDKNGNLSMFGEYRIVKGDYLFTFNNLMNKKFVLNQGGTITWSGSPYDATLHIEAIYNLKTSLHELLMATSTGESDYERDKGKKVPIECILNLSDNLMNPLVKFGINFPTLEAQTKSYIQSLFSSQDEINKQVFSLLVLNRFYRTDDQENSFGAQAGTASVTTITEMMSSQLSRWLSQINNNLDIGLSYRVGDEITTDEIEVMVSTQLLSDRVTLSANGNMDVGGTKSPVTSKNGSSATGIAGDFDMDVKLNRQGTLKLKAYSHTDEKIIYNNTETIQGVGVSYQESFDTFRELLRKYFGLFRKKKA